MGSADTRDPRDKGTETGEKLVAGGSRRRRGLQWVQGHLRVPLLKATPLIYFTRALLDRVLTVANGGAAVLRGVTSANLGNGDAVELADEHERLKTKL